MCLRQRWTQRWEVRAGRDVYGDLYIHVKITKTVCLIMMVI